MKPAALANQFAPNGKIGGSTATFGAPFYGEIVAGKLIYAPPLNPEHPHCSEEGYTNPKRMEELFKKKLDIDYTQESGAQHKEKRVMLVERGGCSFAQKVRVAEDFGAGAVIIVDSQSSFLTKDDIHTVIMSDKRHNGKEIKIPSMLISYEEGKLLIDAVSSMTNTKGDSAIVELSWNVPSNNIVKMDVWMVPSNKAAYTFLSEFRPVLEALKKTLQFIPHFDIYSLDEDYGDDSCYAGQNFCADDPDGVGPITGRMVVTEMVRQMCIWEEHARRVGKDNSYANVNSENVFHSEKYWDYVTKFYAECQIITLEEHKRFGSECSHAVMKSLNIDVDEVEKCVKNEGLSLLALQEQNIAWDEFAVRINGWKFHGDISADLVRKAVCSGFKVEPAECVKMREMDEWLANGGGNHVVLNIIFTILLSLFLIACFSYLFCKNRITEYAHRIMKDEISLQVSSRIAEYRNLTTFDSDDGGSLSEKGVGKCGELDL